MNNDGNPYKSHLSPDWPIAAMGDKRLNAEQTFAIMQNSRFIGANSGFVNQLTVQPDWVGFYKGELIRMLVSPTEFYSAISGEAG